MKTDETKKHLKKYDYVCSSKLNSDSAVLCSGPLTSPTWRKLGENITSFVLGLALPISVACLRRVAIAMRRTLELPVLRPTLECTLYGLRTRKRSSVNRLLEFSKDPLSSIHDKSNHLLPTLDLSATTMGCTLIAFTRENRSIEHIKTSIQIIPFH